MTLISVGTITLFAMIIVGLLVLVVGIKLVSQSGNKNHKLRDSGRSVGNLVIGLAVVGVAAMILTGSITFLVLKDQITPFVNTSQTPRP